MTTPAITSTSTPRTVNSRKQRVLYCAFGSDGAGAPSGSIACFSFSTSVSQTIRSMSRNTPVFPLKYSSREPPTAQGKPMPFLKRLSSTPSRAALDGNAAKKAASFPDAAFFSLRRRMTRHFPVLRTSSYVGVNRIRSRVGAYRSLSASGSPDVFTFSFIIS